MTLADPLDEILRFAVVNRFAHDPLNFLFELGLPSLCLVGLHRDDRQISSRLLIICVVYY